MKWNIFVWLRLFCIIAFFFSGWGAKASLIKYQVLLDSSDRVPLEFIVKSKVASGMGIQNIFSSRLLSYMESFRTFKTDSSLHTVRLTAGANEAEFLNQINMHPGVEYAEPNFLLKIVGTHSIAFLEKQEERVPNDADFSLLWGLRNTGQEDSSGTPGLAGADIGAVLAWNTTTGSRDIVIAVIDTGVDYTHEDLAANIFHNPGESGEGKETDGIDNDGNGFIDDHTGWNFFSSTNNAMDDSEHGTHCAGTIAAVGDNELGISGVSWNSRILPIKFLGSNGSGTMEAAVQSIQYATTMGAHIMSNSYGGRVYSQAMEDAIREANTAGILFVAAAGNDGLNSDVSPHYPSNYKVDNVISVAATNNQDEITNWSTYGKKSVHIAAPGKQIYSTIPGNQYAFLNGTSMAVPHVAGALALILSADPSLSHLEAKNRLLLSRDPKLNLARWIMHSGRLNVYNAIHGIYPVSDEPQEKDWIDGESMEIIESEHPYASNTKSTWKVEAKEKAKYIRLVFSRVELEDRYDFITLYDANRKEVDKMSGNYGANGVKSWYAAGKEILVEFFSDFGLEKWGFAITGYQYIPQDSTLEE